MNPIDRAHSWKSTRLNELKLPIGPVILNSFKEFADREFLCLFDRWGKKETWTFREFAQSVEAFRSVIASYPEKFTNVIVGENTIDTLVAIVASFLEGRTVCPVNPAEGQERIADKIRQIGSPVNVFFGSDSPDFKLPGARRINVEAGIAGEPRPPVPFSPARPLILIFTSGTTGRSKVVQQTESGVIVNVRALIERHRLQEGKTIGTCLPVYHVNALEFSFFCSLVSGGRLVLFRGFSGPTLLRSLQEEKIQILSLVPSLIMAISALLPSVPEKATSPLEYVVSAAAPLSRALAEKIVEKFPCRVLQGYGLSEAVNFSALMPSDLREDEYRKLMLGELRPSIGTEIDGNEIIVVDDKGRELSEGQEGEVALRGLNLMAGYLHENPEVTFFEGFFRTGDLGFFRNFRDGKKAFYVTGRKKEIVKRQGFTISLAEIEDLLQEFSSFEFEGIAVGFENEYSVEDLAVIVKPVGEKEIDMGALRNFVRSRLPAHLRPHLYLKTNREVRGPSGKSLRGSFLGDLKEYENVMLVDTEIFGEIV